VLYLIGKIIVKLAVSSCATFLYMLCVFRSWERWVWSPLDTVKEYTKLLVSDKFYWLYMWFPNKQETELRTGAHTLPKIDAFPRRIFDAGASKPWQNTNLWQNQWPEAEIDRHVAVINSPLILEMLHINVSVIRKTSVSIFKVWKMTPRCTKMHVNYFLENHSLKIRISWGTQHI
jgi:hypothetical protein